MLQTGIQTLKCKVLEVREFSDESYIVVQDLADKAYYILVKFKNWQWGTPKVGSIAYIEMEHVVGGVSTYYSKDNETMEIFKNTYIIFKKYIYDTSESTLNDLIVI